MKNVVTVAIAFIICMLIAMVMIKGITFGSIKILSVEQISEESKKLSKKVDDLNSLNSVAYKNKIEELNQSSKELSDKKSKYLDVASVSSDEEIKIANQSDIYTMEYLWEKIGNYATSEGLNLKMQVVPTEEENRNDLEFVATGEYIGIRNFIYKLEQDDKLKFRIDNFKMIKDEDGRLTGNFKVKNVGIKKETIETALENKDEANEENSESEEENQGEQKKE